jgi:hypothetical protein
MRVTLENNKQLLINIIIFLGSLGFLFFQLFNLNYIFDESKVNLIMIADEYLFFSKNLITEDINFIHLILINLLFVLAIGTLMYYVYVVVSFIRKNHTISMKPLIVLKGIYLLMIIVFLVLHSILIKINALFGYLLLLLVLSFAIYDLVSMIKLFKKKVDKTEIQHNKLFSITKLIILFYPVVIMIFLYIVLSVI